MKPARSPYVWDEAELHQLRLDAQAPLDYCAGLQQTPHNPTPGSGRTGIYAVPPNPFPFYSSAEKYKAVVQADGGQLSEWAEGYAPTKEQADKDRAAAFASGLPHGLRKPGADKEDEGPILVLMVVSEIHEPDEYGANVDALTGLHSGGPFEIRVSARTRVEELRNIIRDEGGIVPALQKLSYAGKRLEDSQRTLEHYGIAYWHARFPHWPLRVRRW